MTEEQALKFVEDDNEDNEDGNELDWSTDFGVSIINILKNYFLNDNVNINNKTFIHYKFIKKNLLFSFEIVD